MDHCDICGAPLKKAPFSSTLFQDRYICMKDTHHMFSKDTATGKLIKASPLLHTMMFGALFAATVLQILDDANG